METDKSDWSRRLLQITLIYFLGCGLLLFIGSVVGGMVTWQPNRVPVLSTVFFNVYLQPIFWALPFLWAYRVGYPQTKNQIWLATGGALLGGFLGMWLVGGLLPYNIEKEQWLVPALYMTTFLLFGTIEFLYGFSYVYRRLKEAPREDGVR